MNKLKPEAMSVPSKNTSTFVFHHPYDAGKNIAKRIYISSAMFIPEWILQNHFNLKEFYYEDRST